MKSLPIFSLVVLLITQQMMQLLLSTEHYPKTFSWSPPVQKSLPMKKYKTQPTLSFIISAKDFPPAP